MPSVNKRDTQQQSDDRRKCSFCNENLKNPKLLPCQHSFCKLCLETYVTQQNDDKFLCSTCDLEITLPPKGVAGLPENYLHPFSSENESLLENGLHSIASEKNNIHIQLKNCVYCEIQEKEKVGDLFCEECDLFLCENCKPFHSVVPSYKHHRLVFVKELTSGEHMQILQGRSCLFCKKHWEGTRLHPLEFYCSKYKTLNCKKCVLQLDKIYMKGTRKTLHTEKMNLLTKDLDIILNNLKEQREIVSVVHKVEARIKQKREATENEILEKATEIQDHVEKMKNEKFPMVKDHFGAELKKYQLLLEKESDKLKRLESTATFVQDFIKNSTVGEYLMNEQDVKTRMNDFMLDREKFEVMTQNLVPREKYRNNLHQGINDAMGLIEKRKKITHITGKEKGAEYKPIILGKIKLNMEARGIAVAKNGDIIVVGGSKINILNKKGISKKTLEIKDLKSAWNVVAKNDLLFVTDSERNSKQLLVLDMDGNLTTAIRMPDSEQDVDAGYGIGVAVSDECIIYVCLEYTSEIYTCTLDDTELKLFTSTKQQPYLDNPGNLSLTSSGNLAVVCKVNEIQMYNDQAQLLLCLYLDKGYDLFESGSESFNSICCDMEDHVIIGGDCDNDIGIVKDGELKKGRLRIPGVNANSGLALDQNGNLLVTHKTNEITKVTLWG